MIAVTGGAAFGGAAPGAHDAPYKGPESFQVEDAALFFGRRREAEVLVARVLSARCTLLHAQSGAGKTSLLNARVIPALEEKGWLTVRVLPQNDPVESLWVSSLAYVLPPPRAELAAARRLAEALAAPGENPALGELLERYDALPVRDPRQRGLIAPVAAAEAAPPAPLAASARFFPALGRVLRSADELAALDEHFRAIEAFAGFPPGPPLKAESRLDQLLARCASPDLERAHQVLVAALCPEAPGPLRRRFARLVDYYGRRRRNFTLVVLLDQFEEVFTRFVDLGPLNPARQAGLPDWRLKYQLFAELRELYRAEPGAEPGRDLLPIRFVISMRSEYIAQLDPIRAFAPELDASVFRLELLDPEGASQAIQAPAREFGFGYSDACYQAIAGELTKEGRFVEPAHVQIVCEKLWNARGRELAAGAGGAGEAAGGEIGLELYRDRLAGAAGILRAFLHDYLDSLGPGGRLEALELLEPLITGRGTRNIVEREALLAAPFRPRGAREERLDALVARTLVRVETRLGGQFAEITHEVLIPPIAEAIQKELYADAEFLRCRAALRRLGQLRDRDSPAQAESRAAADFPLLYRYRDRIEWDDWSRELMFRIAASQGAQRAALRYCAGLLEPAAALAIARDKAVDGEPAERCAALRALSALPSADTAALQVAAALDAPEPQIRAAAAAELAELGPELQRFHAPLLERRLADPDQAARVYSLLGELRREGSPIAVKMPKGWRGLWLGLKLAFSLDQQSRNLVRPGFAGRVLAMSNLTAAIVLVTFGAALWAAGGVASWKDFGPLAMLAVLVFTIYAVAGAAIVTAVSFGSISVDKHYSYWIGFLRGGAWSILGGIVVGGGVFLFLMLLQLVFRQNLGLGPLESLFLISGPAGLSVAVRGGAVFSAPTRTRGNRLRRIAGGALLGFLVAIPGSLLLSPALARKLQGPLEAVAKPALIYFTVLPTGLLLATLLLPLLIAAAHEFACIDDQGRR